ncbi:MAG: hypothetical protein II380_09985 [Prevotella sp.]|nr:hypothetical protein [Prevotella sp.]
MNNYRKNGTTMIRIVCAVLFCTFTFIYVYVYQTDVLAIGQHILSDGQTHYSRFIGAFLITLVLYLLQLGVSTIVKLSKSTHSLTYFPSLLILAVLTSVDSKIDQGFSFGSWVWWFPILLILFALVCRLERILQLYESSSYNAGIFSQSMWINVLTMLVFFFCVGFVGNSDTKFHYRLKMERYISEGKYDEALLVGKKSLVRDSSITMLRAYALSRQGKLPDALFQYTICGGSASLLPNGNNVKGLLFDTHEIYGYLGKMVVTRPITPMNYLHTIIKHHLDKRPAADYLLCGYLLDKDLNSFSANIAKYYNLEEELPRHYSEAIIMYNHLHRNNPIKYENHVIEADYQDYLKLMRQIPNNKEMENKLRDVYGNTYWYYYKLGY